MQHQQVERKVQSKISSENSLAELERLNHDILHLKKNVKHFEKENLKLLTRLHPQYKKSGVNFLHYLALRQSNLKELQLRLARFGLSSLGRCESHVLNNIQQVQERLSDSLKARKKLAKTAFPNSQVAKTLTWSEAEKILHSHTQDLFGPKPPSRHVYIMATAPSRSEFSETWVRNVMNAGTNLIRINCAHDTKSDWAEMVASIRHAAADLKYECRILMDLAGPKIRTATPSHRKLSVGDQLCLVGKVRHKKNEVQCSLPEVFNFVKVGERVLFDDGKIETKVTGMSAKKIHLEITRVPSPQTKLKSEKGINFPDSHINISEVTKQDLSDLHFTATHADMIGLSFVQSPAAIRKIRGKLKKLTDRSPGIILKIETQASFEALPRLLLEAMHGYPCGVMIARGDLGVEVGFERMVELQEEILWLCEAAHVPVIWATQVLENQAKVGMPSRAEVTDAAAAVKAECVMLNKGPFIEAAIGTLDNILKRMEFHTYKKRNIYRKLNVADLI